MSVSERNLFYSVILAGWQLSLMILQSVIGLDMFLSQAASSTVRLNCNS